MMVLGYFFGRGFTKVVRLGECSWDGPAVGGQSHCTIGN
jgi:hypothetical protein